MCVFISLIKSFYEFYNFCHKFMFLPPWTWVYVLANISFINLTIKLEFLWTHYKFDVKYISLVCFFISFIIKITNWCQNYKTYNFCRQFWKFAREGSKSSVWFFQNISFIFCSIKLDFKVEIISLDWKSSVWMKKHQFDSKIIKLMWNL